MGMNTRYVKEYFYKKKIRSMFVWNLEIIAAILLAAAFSWFFCRSVVVQEGSMEPTLVPGERVLMDSAWYRLSSPKRGDIIAFRTSEDKKASIHIKRVIALPGETVQIKDGQILCSDTRDGFLARYRAQFGDGQMSLEDILVRVERRNYDSEDFL